MLLDIIIGYQMAYVAIIGNQLYDIVWIYTYIYISTMVSEGCTKYELRKGFFRGKRFFQHRDAGRNG